MIIYCAGPIKGDTTYQKQYAEIINFVEEEGHTALAEINDKFTASVPLTDRQIYKRDMKWLDGSKMVIAEISGTSLGVGFEIAYAIFLRKIPVLGLVNIEVRNLSAMLSGCESNLLSIERYKDIDDMRRIMQEYINKYDNQE